MGRLRIHRYSRRQGAKKREGLGETISLTVRHTVCTRALRLVTTMTQGRLPPSATPCHRLPPTHALLRSCPSSHYPIRVAGCPGALHPIAPAVVRSTPVGPARGVEWICSGSSQRADVCQVLPPTCV